MAKNKKCIIDKCNVTKIEGYGRCNKHYRQWKKLQKPAVIKLDPKLKPSLERTVLCPDCYRYVKKLKGSVCSRCSRLIWAAKNPDKILNQARKRSEKLKSKHVYVPQEQEIQASGDYLVINANAKILCERANIQIANLTKFLESLKNDLIVKDYTYDSQTLLVKILISKQYELMFSAGLNQKPAGVWEF